MLLAQINRDSQGMAEFHDADGQPVTLCLTEAVTVAGEFSHLKTLQCSGNIRKQHYIEHATGPIIRLLSFISLYSAILQMHTTDSKRFSNVKVNLKKKLKF